MKQSQFNSDDNLQRLAKLLVKEWGKRLAMIRAAELCELASDMLQIGKAVKHFREFDTMREYIKNF